MESIPESDMDVSLTISLTSEMKVVNPGRALASIGAQRKERETEFRVMQKIKFYSNN